MSLEQNLPPGVGQDDWVPRQQHTPEPWHIDAMGNIWADTKICNMREIADRGESYRAMTESEHRANASRIVACVNACVGLEQSFLEAISRVGGINNTFKAISDYMATYKIMEDELEEAERQRDQLLEALKAAMRFIDSHVADPDITPEMTAAWLDLLKINPANLIASVEGGNQS